MSQKQTLPIKYQSQNVQQSIQTNGNGLYETCLWEGCTSNFKKNHKKTEGITPHMTPPEKHQSRLAPASFPCPKSLKVLCTLFRHPINIRVFDSTVGCVFRVH